MREANNQERGENETKNKLFARKERSAESGLEDVSNKAGEHSWLRTWKTLFCLALYHARGPRCSLDTVSMAESLNITLLTTLA